ncbi:MAG: SPFH domain-containing protein [Patescibacteria group bacterium]
MKTNINWAEVFSPTAIERIVVISLFVLFGAGITLLVLLNIWSTIFIALGLIELAIVLKQIPNSPPSLALVTIRGERIKKVKREGLRVFADFFPFFYGAVIVSVEKKNQDLPREVVRTPDLAELEIPISVTWTPGTNKKEDESEKEYNKRLGEFLINYLNNGGEGKDNDKEEKKGIRSILADIIRERVREWAIAEEEGPKTFEEALRAQEQAVAILLKAIAGEEIEKIPSVIPTFILFKYFNDPRGKLTPSEEDFAGKNWENVEKILAKEDEGKIKKTIEERRKIVKRMKAGNGSQPIKALGVTLNRLNIGDIRIKPGTALEKAAGEKVKEEKQRIAEDLELHYVRERIQELMQEPFNFSNEKALEIVQVERKKVTKEIKDFQGFREPAQAILEILARRTT